MLWCKFVLGLIFSNQFDFYFSVLYHYHNLDKRSFVVVIFSNTVYLLVFIQDTAKWLVERNYYYFKDPFVKLSIVYKECTKSIPNFFTSGNLTNRHREIFHRNPLFVGMKLPEVKEVEPIEKRFHRVSSAAMDILKVSLACIMLYSDLQYYCLSLPFF